LDPYKKQALIMRYSHAKNTSNIHRFLLFFISICIFIRKAESTTLTTGLVGYYPFSGNANDASGNGHDAVVHSATLTADRFSSANSAYSFDGTSSSYMEVVDGTGLDLTSTLSISLLINPGNTPMPGGTVLLDKGTGTGGWVVQAITSANNIAFNYNTPSSAGFSTCSVQLISNTWNHYVVTKNSTHFQCYLNNVATGSTATTASIGSTGNLPFVIAAYNGAFTQPASNIILPLPGRLDEIRLYNRYLIPSEVSELNSYGSPTSLPTASPTTALPTGQPTGRPSGQPTRAPTRRPTGNPTGQPSRVPSRRPTGHPTGQPSRVPSTRPIANPTGQPSRVPSRRPTGHPTGQPSRVPSRMPLANPTGQPSRVPTRAPTGNPTGLPSRVPSRMPLANPTGQPSRVPTRAALTGSPTGLPSRVPSRSPIANPTGQPSRVPTRALTGSPTGQPSRVPSRRPIANPTGQPSRVPTRAALTGSPTGLPSRVPSRRPIANPTGQPSRVPTRALTGNPTGQPSRVPSRRPIANPTGQPSRVPSRRPVGLPTGQPSRVPSRRPIANPTGQPSRVPSRRPIANPTGQPSRVPSRRPIGLPTGQPTRVPTGKPIRRPTGHPTNFPTFASRAPTPPSSLSNSTVAIRLNDTVNYAANTDNTGLFCGGSPAFCFTTTTINGQVVNSYALPVDTVLSVLMTNQQAMLFAQKKNNTAMILMDYRQGQVIRAKQGSLPTSQKISMDSDNDGYLTWGMNATQYLTVTKFNQSFEEPVWNNTYSVQLTRISDANANFGLGYTSSGKNLLCKLNSNVVHYCTTFTAFSGQNALNPAHRIAFAPEIYDPFILASTQSPDGTTNALVIYYENSAYEIQGRNNNTNAMDAIYFNDAEYVLGSYGEDCIYVLKISLLGQGTRHVLLCADEAVMCPSILKIGNKLGIACNSDNLHSFTMNMLDPDTLSGDFRPLFNQIYMQSPNITINDQYIILIQAKSVSVTPTLGNQYQDMSSIDVEPYALTQYLPLNLSSYAPSQKPSPAPTIQVILPTSSPLPPMPTGFPSHAPYLRGQPSATPTVQTRQPTVGTVTPTKKPTAFPSFALTLFPSKALNTTLPSPQPTLRPSLAPTFINTPAPVRNNGTNTNNTNTQNNDNVDMPLVLGLAIGMPVGVCIIICVLRAYLKAQEEIHSAEHIVPPGTKVMPVNEEENGASPTLPPVAQNLSQQITEDAIKEDATIAAVPAIPIATNVRALSQHFSAPSGTVTPPQIMNITVNHHHTVIYNGASMTQQMQSQNTVIYSGASMTEHVQSQTVSIQVGGKTVDLTGNNSATQLAQQEFIKVDEIREVTPLKSAIDNAPQSQQNKTLDSNNNIVLTPTDTVRTEEMQPMSTAKSAPKLKTVTSIPNLMFSAPLIKTPPNEELQAQKSNDTAPSVNQATVNEPAPQPLVRVASDHSFWAGAFSRSISFHSTHSLLEGLDSDYDDGLVIRGFESDNEDGSNSENSQSDDTDIKNLSYDSTGNY
jgi:hypothetical protein